MARAKKSSTKKAPAATKSGAGPVIRIVKLQNPRTKRDVLVRVTSDGRLSARDAQHLGVKKVAAWIEVVAKGWAEATQLVRAGKGRKVRTGQDRRGSAPLARAA